MIYLTEQQMIAETQRIADATYEVMELAKKVYKAAESSNVAELAKETYEAADATAQEASTVAGAVAWLNKAVAECQ